MLQFKIVLFITEYLPYLARVQCSTRPQEQGEGRPLQGNRSRPCLSPRAPPLTLRTSAFRNLRRGWSHWWFKSIQRPRVRFAQMERKRKKKSSPQIFPQERLDSKRIRDSNNRRWCAVGLSEPSVRKVGAEHQMLFQQLWFF